MPTWVGSTTSRASVPREVSDSDLTEAGNWLDHYELREVLGRGGFGTVYHAFDHVLQRAVAIKLPRVETILSPDACRRFLKEARACASLTHPAIVQVYETIESPQPAIVYEYCDSGTLRDYQGPLLDERTAVQITIQLCRGLQHAHARGILHRDIKPSNILVNAADADQVDAAVAIGDRLFVPKLSDFGLARLVEDDLGETQTGLIIGTPGFMAPEQTTGRTVDTGIHTDIYSLGAVLYWLLAEKRPYEGGSPTATLALMHADDPLPLRQLNRGVSREVANICRKCLQRRPEDRYESAGAMLRDLEAVQRGEPVSVRSPTPLALLRRCRRRHPLKLTAALVLLLLLAVGVLLEGIHSSMQAALLSDLDESNQQLTAAADAARQAQFNVSRQNRRNEELLYAADLQLAVRSKQDGDLAGTDAVLRRHIPGRDQRDLRDIEWYLLWQETHGSSTVIDQLDGAGYFIAVSPDGQHFVACGEDATARIYETATLKKLQTIETGQEEVNSANFCQGTDLLATAGDDGGVVIWNWRTGQPVSRVQTVAPIAFQAVFTKAGDHFYTCGNHPVIQIWRRSDGQSSELLGHEQSVDAICLSHDDRYLYTAGADGYRCVFDLRTDSLLTRKSSPGGQRVTSVAPYYFQDRHFLVSGLISSESQHFVLLEAATTSRRWRLPMQSDGVQSVAVNNSMGMAAIGNRSGQITLVDLRQVMNDDRDENREAIRGRWVTQHGRVYSLAWLPDRNQILSTGSDGSLRLWHSLHPDAGEDVPEIVRHAYQCDYERPVVSTDLARVYAVADGDLYCWNRYTNQVQRLATGFAAQAALFLSDDHHQLVSFSQEHGLRLWSLETADSEFRGGGRDPGPYTLSSITHDTAGSATATLVWTLEDIDSGVCSVAWSASGDRLLVADRWSKHPVREVKCADGTTTARFDSTTGKEADNFCVAVSPDDSMFAYCEGHAIVCIHRSTGRRTILKGHSSTVKSVCFVPSVSVDEDLDSAWCLVSGSRDRTVRVWEPRTGEQIYELRGHAGVVDSIAVSPNGRSLISAGSLGDVLIWGLSSGVLLREYFGIVPGRTRHRQVLRNGLLEVNTDTGELRCRPWPGTSLTARRSPFRNVKVPSRTD